MISLWTASIWKIKTWRLPVPKKEEPQISTAVEFLVFFDVKLVPGDLY